MWINLIYKKKGYFLISRISYVIQIKLITLAMNNQIYILKQSCRIYGGLHIKITCKVDSINTFSSRQVNNDT